MQKRHPKLPFIKIKMENGIKRKILQSRKRFKAALTTLRTMMKRLLRKSISTKSIMTNVIMQRSRYRSLRRRSVN